jgi:uncharacterized protein (DUF433 family)/predicted nuclease of predicted toxin-antitoxin system
VVEFTRITIDPELMGGVPTLRGLRIPVATVVAMVADGMTTDEILAELPDLEAEDVAEGLRYAAEEVRERHLPLRPLGVRLLLDNNLSPRLVGYLRNAGHDVVHVRDHGLQAAPDEQVLGIARQQDRTLDSADTDFGTLLARTGTGARGPSVLLIRRSGARRAADLAALLLANLDTTFRRPERRCRRSGERRRAARSTAADSTWPLTAHRGGVTHCRTTCRQPRQASASAASRAGRWCRAR